jgi:hypothetical protein
MLYGLAGDRLETYHVELTNHWVFLCHPLVLEAVAPNMCKRFMGATIVYDMI